METLIIKSKGVVSGTLPKYNTNTIKLVQQGDGSGSIYINITVSSSMVLTIAGGVFIEDGNEVNSLSITPAGKTLIIRLDDHLAYINLQKPYTFSFSEALLDNITENSPRVDYTHLTTGLQNITNMFSENRSFNRPVTGLRFAQTLQNRNASNMFLNAVLFNSKLDLETHKISTMVYMFAGATSFNQDISDWDVSNVTNMTNMFAGATSFNQDISDWDVSNVTNMTNMFASATSFNQDISVWDVSNVTNMTNMFANATSFNQDISDFNLNINVNLTDIFNNAQRLSPENYGKFLVMMAAKDWTGRAATKVLGANSVKYSAASASARAALVDSGWTITDGGQA